VLASGEKAAAVEPSDVTAVEKPDFSEFLMMTAAGTGLCGRAMAGRPAPGDANRFLRAHQTPEPGRSAAQRRCDAKRGLAAIELSACSLARLVECSLTGRTSRWGVIFSDNYFDLPAGKVIRITAPCRPDGVSHGPGSAQVRSVYDTYAVNSPTEGMT